jgi:hypothetical protein
MISTSLPATWPVTQPPLEELELLELELLLDDEELPVPPDTLPKLM